MSHTEILLIKPVEGLGAEGDQVKVRNGYARNYLLPQKIGVAITAANRKFGWWAIPLAAALAFSRLYLFVHFPSDILFGALIGAALGLAAVGLSRKLPERIRRVYTKKRS